MGAVVGHELTHGFDSTGRQYDAQGNLRDWWTPQATAEFKKATGILQGLWERVRERPGTFLDRRTIDRDGLDAATRDFLAGMTDRYAIALFEHLFIPKPWVDLGGRFDDGPSA